MPLETLKMIYFAYFHSIMSYGIIFWGNQSYSDRIFNILFLYLIILFIVFIYILCIFLYFILFLFIYSIYLYFYILFF
jgi:hypothetical protein